MLLEMAEQFWTRLPCHAKLSRKEITKFEAKQERQTEKWLKIQKKICMEQRIAALFALQIAQMEGTPAKLIRV